MRITDLYFFIWLGLDFLIVLAAIIFGFEIPDWLMFWWVFLLPVVFLKLLFPRAKITQWFEKERW
jgi:hypothetical protein